jgi:hypothetical protein
MKLPRLCGLFSRTLRMRPGFTRHLISTLGEIIFLPIDYSVHSRGTENPLGVKPKISRVPQGVFLSASKIKITDQTICLVLCLSVVHFAPLMGKTHGLPSESFITLAPQLGRTAQVRAVRTNIDPNISHPI